MDFKQMLFTDDEVSERRRLHKALIQSFRLFAKYYGWRIFIRALEDAVNDARLEANNK